MTVTVEEKKDKKDKMEEEEEKDDHHQQSTDDHDVSDHDTDDHKQSNDDHQVSRKSKGVLRDASRRLLFSRTPKVLTVHINRCVYWGDKGKIRGRGKEGRMWDVV